MIPVVAIDNITDTVDRQHRLIGESTCRLSRIDRDDDGNDAIAHDVDRCERIVTFQHCRVVKVAVADRVVRQCRSNGGITTVLTDMLFIVVQAYANGWRRYRLYDWRRSRSIRMATDTSDA